MGRLVVLSNGQMFVGLDENGLVQDFYYPYVGLENLTNARICEHKIGVWVDGQFKWTNDGSWKVEVDFEVDALISNISLKSSELGVTLLLQDFVDIETNALIRHITLTNDRDTEHDIRLFMHQVFQLSQAGRADTALYVPDDHYILDYKGRFSLLVAGKFEDGESFDQYAVGIYAIEGRVGTFADAEDGELSGNPVEHGGVDSVIRFNRHLSGGQSTTIDYWVIVASSQTDVQDIHTEFKNQDMKERLDLTRLYWQNWLRDTKVNIPDYHKRSLQHSLLVIKAHCDARGSVLASGDSSIFNYGRDYYCYCWPRDSFYALWPLIRLGHFDEVERFLNFARDTMHRDGYLMHKYQPDRTIGSTWHPLIHNRHKELAIQEDETACVIYMIGLYYAASHDKILIEDLYNTFIVPCANFMSSYVDAETGLPHASYDLWEEKFLTSTYTVCTVIAGLKTAAEMAELVDRPDDAVRWKRVSDNIASNLNKLCHKDGYFIKGLLLEDGKITYDNTLDISSLYGPYMYSGLPIDDERIVSTAKQVEKRILNTSPIGGVVRYEHDNYFLSKPKYTGNPWMVCTLWMAQYYKDTNQSEKAEELLKWALSREQSSGVLSEQFDPETGDPLGATPLVWSHAEMVNTLIDLHKSHENK